MSYMFTPIKDGLIVLQSAGVYKMAELYERHGEVYAKHGSGFVGLRKGGNTTKGKLRWDYVNPEFRYDKLGRMVR